MEEETRYFLNPILFFNIMRSFASQIKKFSLTSNFPVI